MNKNKKEINKIENEVLKTLQCLDQIDKVKASPFFYKKVMQKIEYSGTKEKQSILQNMITKRLQPMLIPLSVAASILLGILIGYGESSDSRTENLEYFVSAYGIEAPNLDNYQLLTKE